jgi:hypothetical protein
VETPWRTEKLTLFSCDEAPGFASFAFRSRFCAALAPLPIAKIGEFEVVCGLIVMLLSDSKVCRRFSRWCRPERDFFLLL